MSSKSKVIEGQKSLANLTASQGSRAGSLESKGAADPFAFNVESQGLGSDDKDEIMEKIDEV